MGDEEHGHVHALAQVFDQLQDLGLDGYVECGGWLVGEQELGVTYEGERDQGALAHAAGKLVGVAIHLAGGVGQADKVKHFDGAVVGLGGVNDLVLEDSLGDLLSDGHHRVNGAHRFLEDH